MARISLSEDQKIGKIEGKPSEFKEIEWIIPDFFSLIEKKDHVSWESHIFSFNDDLWWLELFLGFHGRINLYLRRKLKFECPIEYFIGLKKKNNRLKYLGYKNSEEDEITTGYLNTEFYVDYFSLLRQKHELVPCDVLTVICILKLNSEVTYPILADLLDKPKPFRLINLDKLSENFKDLFGNKETCDTTLKVQNKDYRAHRIVLTARSSVFEATFKHDSLESLTGVVNIPDCDSDSFQEFLEYLYSGKLEEISFSSAIHLYYTSDKYDVLELKVFCVEYLMKCLTIENVCEIAVFADKYDEVELYSKVENFFVENAFEILLTSEWDNLLKKDHHLANKLLKQMSKMKVKK